MKSVIYLWLLALVCAIIPVVAQAAPGDISVIGPASMPWVDSARFSNLSTAKQSATKSGRMLMVTTPGAVNNITFGCPVAVIRGGSITVASGKTAYYNEFHAGQSHYCLMGPGKHVFLGGIPRIWAGWQNGLPSIADSYPGIQASINSVTDSLSGVSIVSLTAGNYSTSSDLGIYRWNGSNYDYVNCILEGPSLTSDTMKGVKIIPTFNDRPALWVQKGRSVEINNIQAEGKNTINFTADQVMSTPANAWTVGGARDSRYSPYGGIVIDPFSPTVPPDGGYPGLTSYYRGSGGSSRVAINNCTIRHFVVGVMDSPNAVTQNAENIKINDCWIDHNKVAVATGQSQTRSVYINRLTCWGSTFILVDSANYGQGNGAFPIVEGGNIAGGVKYLFTNSTAWSYVTVKGLYAEGIGGIGHFDTILPVTFSGCYFHIMNSDNGTDRSVDYVLVSRGPVKFDGCYLGKYRGNTAPLNFSGSGNYTFDTTTFDNYLFSDVAAYGQWSNTFRNVQFRYIGTTPIGLTYGNDKVLYGYGGSWPGSFSGRLYLSGTKIITDAPNDTYATVTYTIGVNEKSVI